MTTILQISDPHFGTEQAPVCEALITLATQVQPDLLILSGDITQRARSHQFAAARRFVDQLGATHCLAIPGNHDIPLYNVFDRAFRPWSNHCEHFGEELEPVLDSGQVLVVALNTTRRYRHKHGEVSQEQVHRVGHRLARAGPQVLRIVVTHQPLAVSLPKDEINLLRGHEAAIRHWSAAGADVVLGGHIHLPYVLGLHERDPSLPRPLWVVQAGTAVSSRTRSDVPNSVNLLRWLRRSPAGQDARGDSQPSRHCTVERWDFDAASGHFLLAAGHELALSPS